MAAVAEAGEGPNYDTSLSTQSADANNSRKENSGVDFPKSGVYFAVVASAFGLVRALSHNGQDKTERLLHPWAMLFLALPLFSGQLTMIMSLRLDLEMGAGLVKDQDD